MSLVITIMQLLFKLMHGFSIALLIITCASSIITLSWKFYGSNRSIIEGSWFIQEVRILLQYNTLIKWRVATWDASRCMVLKIKAFAERLLTGRRLEWSRITPINIK